MKLIKNIQVYAPEDLGVKDVLISDSKIEKIDDHITYKLYFYHNKIRKDKR